MLRSDWSRVPVIVIAISEREGIRAGIPASQPIAAAFGLFPSVFLLLRLPSAAGKSMPAWLESPYAEVISEASMCWNRFAIGVVVGFSLLAAPIRPAGAQSRMGARHREQQVQLLKKRAAKLGLQVVEPDAA
jgi:hypothetical protein